MKTWPGSSLASRWRRHDGLCTKPGGAHRGDAMKAVIRRLRKLEVRQRLELAEPAAFRYGWVTPLPEGYAGERHLVMIKCEPSRSPNIEWCEFEERAGSASQGAGDDAMTVWPMLKPPLKRRSRIQ
jgi:hypothetical protein